MGSGIYNFGIENCFGCFFVWVGVLGSIWDILGVFVYYGEVGVKDMLWDF